MNKDTANAILVAIMIATLFFLSGFNNTRINTLSDKIEQLEVYHEIRER
jgi:hypothetical protein